MSIHISKLQIENVKRVKAVTIEPTATGLTIIGGKNRQGKTSVLDAIAWALGGDKYRPSEPSREGALMPPALAVTLSNGLVVERKGKNSDLKVTDPTGQKAGQKLLDSFVEQLALDLPKFMVANDKDKAETLLRIIGVGDKLKELERQESESFNQRTAIGRIRDQKVAFAKEQEFFPDAPHEPVNAADLIKQQQEILAKNGENQRKRESLSRLQAEQKQLETQLTAILTKKSQVDADLKIAQKSAENLQDESTAELEQNLAAIDEINRQVRANLDKDRADDEARQYETQYDQLSSQVNHVRQQKTDLLKGADLPLPGLSVVDGAMTFNGQRWDNMSGADQLIVATSIVRKLNPECGFVLLDKLEGMDLDTLKDFGDWLKKEGLQAIATRVSSGDECSIIIEDGYAVEPENTTPQTAWKAGQF